MRRYENFFRSPTMRSCRDVPNTIMLFFLLSFSTRIFRFRSRCIWFNFFLIYNVLCVFLSACPARPNVSVRHHVIELAKVSWHHQSYSENTSQMYNFFLLLFTSRKSVSSIISSTVFGIMHFGTMYERISFRRFRSVSSVRIRSDFFMFRCRCFFFVF